ncbi:acyl carrier protein [Streptosporangium sp. G11]|uniref:acyl carrier protein n=1 Tax=Streptosporangium sp. G11 TaxID=3436926 RepID=UPI003EBA5A1D
MRILRSLDGEMRMSAEKQEILAFVIHIIEDVVGITLGDDIGESTPVGPQGLGLESISMLEVLVQLEREYEITLPDEAMDELLSGTLGGFVDEVVKYRSAVHAGERA